MDLHLEPTANNLLLLIAPGAGGALMLDLIARLACQGPLRVLDAGNRFDAHILARLLRGQTADWRAALERTTLARAFTCYQVAALLKETSAQKAPTLVLDLLSTFYDESVPAAESRRLLEVCLAQLQRLNRLAPVAVSVRPGPPTSGGKFEARTELLEILQAAAVQVWTLEPHIPPPPPQLL